MAREDISQKGAIIMALLFVLILVSLGIFFIYQVYLEEENTVSRDVQIQDIGEEQSKLLVQ